MLSLDQAQRGSAYKYLFFEWLDSKYILLNSWISTLIYFFKWLITNIYFIEWLDSKYLFYKRAVLQISILFNG